MSEYFLADHRADERKRQSEPETAKKAPPAQEIKVSLLGDFLFPVSESTGNDPYNSVQGKAARDAWDIRRRRR
jgi:hypothetical protein